MTWYHDDAVAKKLAELVAMWRAKKIKNTTEIARILNRDFKLGVTANAVAGRIHRMGKPMEKGAARAKLERLWFGPPVPEPEPEPAPEAAHEPDAETFAPLRLMRPTPEVPRARVPGKITFHQLNLRRDCKWPTGGEREHTLFCGETQVEGKPYCKHHCGVAYGRVIVVSKRR